jgi:phosphoribosylamine--glycine ligase
MVLEFNVRFGDPETQVLLPLVKSDLFDLLYGAATGELPEKIEIWQDRTAAAVVMAAEGYPGDYRKGCDIEGLDDVISGNVVVFHAGTTRGESGLVTNGGRVLAVAAWDDDLGGALDAAYGAVGHIRFDDAYWRKDIGHRALDIKKKKG